MFADVPTRGFRTVYGLLGDWFAWLCCALAVLVVVLGTVGRRRGAIS
jgi:apolipoprotein N-acyltransferase